MGAVIDSSISPADLGAYHRDGLLVGRGLFATAGTPAVSQEAERPGGRDDLKGTNNVRCRWQDHVRTGGCLFETFDPVADISPAWDRSARDPGSSASCRRSTAGRRACSTTS